MYKVLVHCLFKLAQVKSCAYVLMFSKMHSNEANLFYKQVKMTYSVPHAYAVFCSRFIITVN